jgi:hypothetical protein
MAAQRLEDDENVEETQRKRARTEVPAPPPASISQGMEKKSGYPRIPISLDLQDLQNWLSEWCVYTSQREWNGGPFAIAQMMTSVICARSRKDYKDRRVRFFGQDQNSKEKHKEEEAKPAAQ